MKDNHLNYSDEHLNAYLDNELAGEERTHLIEELRDNDDLRQRVCKLEQVRNMVSIAYHDLPEPQQKIETHTRRFSSYASIAASVLIMFGLIAATVLTLLVLPSVLGVFVEVFRVDLVGSRNP